jgi:flagellar biosynthesis protein FlhA
MDPGRAHQLIQRVNAAVEGAVGTDGQPVLLSSPVVRPHLAQLLQRFLPTVPVISQAEIPADIRLTAVANVVLD